MYRPSNERYSESSQMNSMGNYPPPPISNHPKMHMLDGNYPPPPMPVYYDPSQPYEYAPPPPPPQNPNSQPYDNRYAGWRDPSEQKAPMMMNPPLPPGMPHYDMRPPMHHEPYPPQPQTLKGNMQPPEGFQPQQQPPPSLPPQVNVVQRISGIIKSQLSYLQSIMLYADRRTQEERNKKERQRSRSRSRDRPTRNPPMRFHREWNCVKCSFLNFDFRDRCKRCNEPKPAESQQQQPPPMGRPETGGRGYVPGPDDWRCNKCGNINYARRLQCHRCRTPRNK